MEHTHTKLFVHGIEIILIERNAIQQVSSPFTYVESVFWGKFLDFDKKAHFK